MKTETFYFVGYHGTELHAIIWQPAGEVKALLQLTHGMTEHIDRYAAFAASMAEKGIAVAGFDLRGHGRNSKELTVASMGENGWDKSIEDMKIFYDLLKKRFPDTPHYLHGFSLGSFLLREYLSRYPDGIAGAIIMGTGYQPQPVLSIMQAIAKNQSHKYGFNRSTALVKKLSFGIYNQKFKPNNTIADWLCSDRKQLYIYLEDPLMRRDISAGLFWELLGSMKRTGRPDAYTHWNTNTPILLLSGQDDPVGDSGKGVQTVYSRMRKAGLENVTMFLLPGARHDVLHEEASGAASEARRIITEWLAIR